MTDYFHIDIPDDCPYQDWHDFDIKKGDKIAFTKGDELFTCIVTSVVEDEKTGEVRISCR